jgi:cobalt-zinc-cadmium efflux system outer membrane protein
VAFVLGVVVSRQAAADPLRLTIDEAIAQMRAQSPDVVVAALKVRAAQGDLRTARELPNPTLSVGVGNFPLGKTNPPGLHVGDTVVVQGGLSEEIVMWGKRPARIDHAANAVTSAEASRVDLDRTATFEVRRRFLEVLAAVEHRRLAQENLDRYRETVRVSEARARSGDISRNDFDKIALEQRGFEREVADADLDRRQAVADLLPLIGADADDIDPVGRLELPPPPGDVDALVAQALDHRPDLHAAQADVAAAEAAATLARAEAWPNPTVGVGYTHSEFQVSGDLANSIGANLSIALPVASRNEGAIEHAEADALSAHAAERKLRLTIPQEVRSAVASYDSARARVERFEHGFLDQAAKARKAAEVSYREGSVSLLELLEAERTYIQTQRDYLDALRDGHTAAYDVERAAAIGGRS